MRSLAIQFDSKPVQERMAIAVFLVLAVACTPSAQASQATTSTTLAITSGTPAAAAASVSWGRTVTLTAGVSSGSASLHIGLVRFCNAASASCAGNNLIGTAQLTSSGAATFKFVPSIGTHSFKAIFAGSDSYESSSSVSGSLSVTGTYPSATTISYLNGKFSASVAAPGDSTNYPTGDVSFLDANNGSSTVGTAALMPLTLSRSLIGAGTYSVDGPVVTADFNGDGILDIATAQDAANTVTILFGRGDGTFTANSPISIPGTSESLVVGDFNGDGHLDLASSNYAGTLTVLIGQGDGTFAIQPQIALAGGGGAATLEDFNRDGVLDIAIVVTAFNGSGSTGVVVLLGKGDGTFIAQPIITGFSDPNAIAAADFNGDGNQDLVVTDYNTSTVNLLLGKGDGTFTSKPPIGLTDFSMGSVAVGDFNGDGYVDIVTTNFNANPNYNTVAVLFGDGEGDFTIQTFTPFVNVQLATVAVADFNQDGIPDLALSLGNLGEIGVLIGKGDGTFAAGSMSSTVAASGSLAIGDFNGDGAPDIASATVLLNLQTESATSSEISLGVGTHSIEAQYPGNSYYDSSLSSSISLSVPSGTSSTTLAVTTGPPSALANSVSVGTIITLTSTVSSGSVPVTSGQVRFCDATSADCSDAHLFGTAQVNSSGIASFKFAPSAGNHNYAAEFVGTDAFASSTSSIVALNVTEAGIDPTTTSITQSGAYPNYVLTASVAGPQLAGARKSAYPSGIVSFVDTSDNNSTVGSASLGSPLLTEMFSTQSTSPVGARPESVVVGDFNGDGIDDLATANEIDGTVSILLGKGDATFRTSRTVTVGKDPVALVACDLNRDGFLDLSVANLGGNSITVLLGNGDGTFKAGLPYSVGNGPASIVVADFNRDGIPDLATTNLRDDSVSVLLGIGDGTFTAQTPAVVGPYPQAIASGDLNGDGIPDLVVANPGDDFGKSLSVLLGKGDGTFLLQSSPIVNTNPISVVIGDFNGDGIPDLAVGLSGDSLGDDQGLAILLGDGRGNFTTSSIYPVGTPSSLILGDFNGDGILDLAANIGGNEVLILLGKGDGTFPLQNIPTAGDTPISLAVGDFNDDGIPDLAVTIGANSVVALTNQFLEVSTAVLNTVSIEGGGTHTVDASYPGDTNYGGSVSAVTSLFTYQSTTVTSLVASATSATYGTPVTLSATVAVSAGSTAPTGTVTFYAGLNALGSVSLSSGVASFSTSTLSVGTYTITASYSGDPNCGPSTSATLTLTITGLSTTAKLAVSPTTSTVGSPITFTATITETNGSAIPTGRVDFIYLGTFGQIVIGSSNLLGTGVATYTSSSLAVGSYSVSASYEGDTANASSTSATINVVVGPVSSVGTTTALSASATGITIGSSITFTATVSQSTGSQVPTGTVTFSNGSNALGSASLNASGVATLATTSLPLGTDSITAAYGASSTFAASTSSPVTVVVSSPPMPAVTLSPTSLRFASQTTGTTSAAQAFTLTNSGNAALSLTSVTISGDFAETNNCGTSVAAGASCSVMVTFTPSVAGSRNGSASITDNATGSPQTVSMTGTGVAPVVAAPAVTLSPTSLTFAAETVGTASAAQTVTLTNSGTAPLSLTSIAASGDFAVSQSCGASLAAGGTCTLSVTFTATATGTRTGTLSITDNAMGSLQTVSLTGGGEYVTLSSSSSGLSISSPGGAATGTIQIAPVDGFTGTVNLTCTVAYQGQGTASDPPTCALSPAQTQISGTTPVSSTLTVSTTAATASAVHEEIFKGAGVSLAALLCFGLLPRRRWRRSMLLIALGVAATAGFIGCGSSPSGSSAPPSNPGTTAGSYVVTVTATNGTAAVSTTVSLSLQ